MAYEYETPAMTPLDPADGSNDPLKPTVLSASAMAVSISGQVSATDPDYFYIAPQLGMRLKSLTLEHYKSDDPIAFVAIQQGPQFSAGYDISKMLFGRHFGPADLNKNLLEGLTDKAQAGISLWINQTGQLTDYVFAIQFEVMQGEDVLGTPGADKLTGTDAPERLFGSLGNDTLEGGLRADTVDGGEGLDTALYRGIRENFSVITSSAGSIAVDYKGPAPAVYPPLPTEGPDSLVGIERIQFADRSVAFDLQSNAGSAARALATVFGKDALKNTSYAGIAISLFDQGMTKDQVSQVAIDAVLGANPKSTDVVKLLWKNLFNADIDAPNLTSFSGLIDSKAMTAAQLTTLAADLDLTAQLIDLAGLSKTGWEYVPFGT